MKVTPTKVSKQEQIAETLVESALSILRGFVRLYIGRMGYDIMAALLCRALVEEGCRRVSGTREGKVVLSRVALLTGVRTQVVKDLAKSTLHYSHSGLTAEATILARWSNDPCYRNERTGKPDRLLVFGTGKTFQRLVSVVAGRGVTTQTVLERIITAGNARIVNEHWLELINPSWDVIEEHEEYALQSAADSLSAHISTIVHNINTEPDNRWFERRVGSIRVPKKNIPVLRRHIYELLQQQKETLCKLLREDELVEAKSDFAHVSIGYFYTEHQSEGDAPSVELVGEKK